MERLQAVLLIILIGLTYLVSPIITFFLAFIFIVKKRKESFGFSLLLGFSLAYPALYYLPLLTDDASRIFDVVNSMQAVQITNLINWLQLWAEDYLNFPIFTTLMYLVSQTAKTTFLSYLSVGITYALICYTISKFSRIFEISSTIKSLVLIASFFWINFLELVSGMRFPLASCLTILIILNLFVFKPKINYFSLLYFLIPLGIHPGSLIIIGPVIFIWLIKKYNNVLFRTVIIILVTMGFLLVLDGHILQNNYTGMLLRRFNAYQTTTFGYVLEPQRIIHLIIGVSITIISLFLLHGISVKKPNINNSIFIRLYQLNKLYFFYYCILMFLMNIEMRMMVATPIIAILGIAAKTSRRIREDLRWHYFVILFLLLLIITGAIYNKSLLSINFEPIPWFFPF